MRKILIFFICWQTSNSFPQYWLGCVWFMFYLNYHGNQRRKINSLYRVSLVAVLEISIIRLKTISFKRHFNSTKKCKTISSSSVTQKSRCDSPFMAGVMFQNESIPFSPCGVILGLNLSSVIMNHYGSPLIQSQNIIMRSSNLLEINVSENFHSLA